MRHYCGPLNRYKVEFAMKISSLEALFDSLTDLFGPDFAKFRPEVVCLTAQSHFARWVGARSESRR